MWPQSLTALPQDLPKDHRRFDIAEGDPGTAQTIEKIRSVVDQGKRDFRIRSLAIKILKDAGVQEKDYSGYAKAFHDYIRSHSLYVLDPVGIELIASADKTMQAGGGDCDCQVGFFCSLAESVGLPCRLLTIRADNAKPDEFSHIFSQVRIPGKGWITSDTTMPNGFGWTPKGYEAKAWPASHDDNSEYSEVTVSGMSMMECPAQADSMSGMFGMSGMGKLSGSAEELSLSSVLDGSAYDELRAAKDDSDQRAIEAGQLLTDARSSGDSNAVSAATQAIAAVGKERQSLSNAINAYSSLANNVQTYSYGAYKPAQLSGMGSLGIAPAIIAGLLIIGAVYVAAQAFSVAMSAYRGDAAGSESYIQQARDAISATGTAVQQTGSAITKSTATIGVVALVGVGAYVLVKMLSKNKWKMPKLSRGKR